MNYTQTSAIEKLQECKLKWSFEVPATQDDRVETILYTHTCAQDTVLMLVTILTACGKYPYQLIRDNTTVIFDCVNLILSNESTLASLLFMSSLGEECFPKSKRIAEYNERRTINCQTNIVDLCSHLPGVKLPYHKLSHSECSKGCGVKATNFGADRSCVKLQACDFLDVEQSVSDYFELESEYACNGKKSSMVNLDSSDDEYCGDSAQIIPDKVISSPIVCNKGGTITVNCTFGDSKTSHVDNLFANIVKDKYSSNGQVTTLKSLNEISQSIQIKGEKYQLSYVIFGGGNNHFSLLVADQNIKGDNNIYYDGIKDILETVPWSSQFQEIHGYRLMRTSYSLVTLELQIISISLVLSICARNVVLSLYRNYKRSSTGYLGKRVVHQLVKSIECSVSCIVMLHLQLQEARLMVI